MLFCLSLMFPFPVMLQAQEDNLADQMMEFVDDFNRFTLPNSLQVRFSKSNLQSSSFVRILRQKVHLQSNDYHSVEFRWNAFIQSKQTDIANSEYLMGLMAEVEEIKQAAHDSLDALQKKSDALADFIDAEQLLLSQDTIYKELYNKAFKLSLMQQLAPQLEKIKAEEQTLFEKIQNAYEKSKTSAQLIPQLTNRAATLDGQFYSLKALSTKIQAMQYEPPIQRIKDYLLGLACVAIILIFINMIVSKLQAAKKARETLKKQKKFFEKTDGNDYPTI